jgi:hypothetical protein
MGMFVSPFSALVQSHITPDPPDNAPIRTSIAAVLRHCWYLSEDVGSRTGADVGKAVMIDAGGAVGLMGAAVTIDAGGAVGLMGAAVTIDVGGAVGLMGAAVTIDVGGAVGLMGAAVAIGTGANVVGWGVGGTVCGITGAIDGAVVWTGGSARQMSPPPITSIGAIAEHCRAVMDG